MQWRSRAMLALTVLAVVGLLAGIGGGGVALAGPRDEEPADERGGERNDRDRSNEEPQSDEPVQLDSDGDFIADVADNCPGVANIGQQDMNGDGYGDACQPAPDSDGDGAGDDVDNCPGVSNPNQVDGDGNGIGNACDAPPEEPPPPADEGGDNGNRNNGDGNNGEGGGQGENGDAASDGGTEERNGDSSDDASDEPTRERENRERNRDERTSTDQAVEDADQTASERLPRVRDLPAIDTGIREPGGPPPAVKSFDPPAASFETITKIDAGAGAKSADDNAAETESGDRGDEADQPAADEADVEEGDGTEADAASDDLLTRLAFQAVTTQAAFQAATDEGDGEPAETNQADTESDAEAGDGEAADAGDGEAADAEPAETRTTNEEPADLLDGEPIEREASEGNADADANGDGAAPLPADRGEESADDVAPMDDWERDRYFAGGLARMRPEATKIAGTRDDDLYLTQRRGEGAGKRGEFAYAIPVPEDGTYQVRLHFAETYWGAPGGPEDGEGQRIFTVSAEDQPELRNYDIYDDVGAMTAVIKEFEVEVDDGELDLRFVAKRDQPAVAAIEVLAEPDGERWVDVDRASQSVQLMVGDQMIARYQASMSAGRLDGFQDTMPGSYQIQSKIAELTYTPYADNYFMYWAGFDPARENGFHSWVMDAKGRVVDGGDGPTWGCIATSPEEAAEIYAFVEIGTRIEIR